MKVSYFSEPIKEILNLTPNLEYIKNIYNRITDLILIRNKKENNDKNITLKEDIYIKNLTYKIGLNYLIKDINLKIKYGTKIILYGKSGIGKSTLMKIIIKYLDDYEGNIYLGKINLKFKSK